MLEGLVWAKGDAKREGTDGQRDIVIDGQKGRGADGCGSEAAGEAGRADGTHS